MEFRCSMPEILHFMEKQTGLYRIGAGVILRGEGGSGKSRASVSKKILRALKRFWSELHY